MATHYKTAPGQTPFYAEERVGDYVISYPLGSNEPTAMKATAPFEQLREHYVRPAENKIMMLETVMGPRTFYFVDDVDFDDRGGGGFQRWNRIWATVPATWVGDGGTYVFEFPGYVVGIAFGSIFSISGITVSGASLVIATGATGISSGDQVFLDLDYTRNGIAQHHTYVTKVTAASSGVSVTIPSELSGSGAFTSVSGTVRKGNIGRSAAEALVVGSRIVHDYALTSAVAVDTDLPIVSKFQPVNSSGVAVNVLSTGNATTPNSATYSNMVTNGVDIPAETSSWGLYMGGIRERTTRVVKAV